MFTIESIKKSIVTEIPNAEVEVFNPRQDNEHFLCSVTSASFEGKNPIEQHKMVYRALKKEFSQGLHSLSLKTYVKKNE